METYQLRCCLKNMLICVINNRLASYLDEKFCEGEKKQQFLHDPITMGSNGEKRRGDSFRVHCVYSGLPHVICIHPQLIWHGFHAFAVHLMRHMLN